MRIGNWEIGCEAYWNDKALQGFYMFFFSWTPSWADLHICFCNVDFSIYNYKKDMKYWDIDSDNEEIDDFLKMVGKD